MPTFLAQASDWTALQTEIETDPAGLGYAGKPAPAVAALLNTPGDRLATPQPWTRPAPHVPLSAVIQWAAQPDGSSPAPITTITDAANDDADGTRGTCLAALRIFGAVGYLDVSHPINLRLIQDLATAGKITAGQQAGLLALGAAPASRAEQLWGAGTTITAEQLRRVGL